MPWRCATWCRHESSRRGRHVAARGCARISAAMGGRSKRARAPLSRRDDQAQHQRGRDLEALRRCDDDCRHHIGSRTRVRDVRSVRGCHSLRHLRGGEEMAASPVVNAPEKPVNTPARPGPPLWLLLELTYRCPLHCVFCYNPTDFASTAAELGTDDWLRVLRQARALGAVQLGLSGGEPLTRDDLEPIVAEAHRLGFYTKLITFGVGLEGARLHAPQGTRLGYLQLFLPGKHHPVHGFPSSTRTLQF